MAVWFTSDQHYDHKNIIKYCGRPFKDVDHMVEMMIRRHNECVMPDDEVWHLGDFSLSAPTVAKILPRLSGRHRLIAGNHDGCHPMREKSKSLSRLYLEAGFLSIDVDVSLYFEGVGAVRMCHLPYVGDSQEKTRFNEWRPVKGDEVVLLHGHVHEKWKARPGMLNVGVDAWDFRPISIEDVRTSLIHQVSAG